METWEQIWPKLVGILALLILVGVPVLFLTGRWKRFGLKPLARCFNGLELHEFSEPGDVSIVYHTYRGFLIWFEQEEHEIHASAEDAVVLLKRLLRFNLTWGLLSYGALFIPMLAIGNYCVQMRSIRFQIESGSVP